jgi:hypothetical protein
MNWTIGTTLMAVAFAHTGAYAQSQNSARPIPIVDTLRLGAPTSGGHSLSAIRGVAPLRNGGAALLGLTSTGWVLDVVSPSGTLSWTRLFERTETPMSLGAISDTLVVQTGIGRAAGIAKFVSGQDAPTSASAVPESERAHAVFAAPGVAILVEGPNRIAGGFEGAGYPTYNFYVIGGPGRTPAPVLRWVDSTPRPVVAHPRRDIQGSIALLMPWAPRPSFAVSANEIYVARGDAYHVQVFGFDGRPVRRIVVPASPSALDTNLRDRWVSAWKVGLVGRLYPDSVRQLVGSFPVASRRPAIGSLFADADGTLAVVRSDLEPDPVAGTDSIRVDLLDSTGNPLGQVALAPGTSVVALAAPFLYATLIDDRASVRTTEGAIVRQTQLIRYRLGLRRSP